MKEYDLLDRLFGGVDRITLGTSRLLARRTSRRSVLGRLGTLMVGMAAIPVLPVFREALADMSDVEEMGDPQSCDYWRYCAFGGSLCSCCGGTHNSCPPGSEAATVAWVGTCLNPTDGKQYLISYNDCCGKSYCDRCNCHGSEGNKPVYYPSKSNQILWCFGANSHAYHCTVALVVGEA